MQVEKIAGGERRVGKTQIYVVGPDAADHVEALRDTYPDVELIPAAHPPADAPFVFTDAEKQARKEAAERRRTITLPETAEEGNRRERRRLAALNKQIRRSAKR